MGSTLTVKPGVWAPAPVPGTFQWLLDGKPIAGATATSLAVTTAHAGHAVSVQVTGSKVGYAPLVRTSAPVSVPLLALTAAPVPTIAGTAKVGSTLTVKPGVWAPAPVALQYQWMRGGTPIAGAVKATYVLTAADAGAAITVKVTGARAGYTSLVRTSAAVRP